MMNKIFNLTSTFKSLESDDGSVMIRGMASTADFDRAGDSISAEAWQKGGLSNFEKNPIILFNHDYDKPIGRATGLKAGPDGLELEAKISKAAPANVAQLVKDGVLGAFSVGFRVKDADYIQETDGLKIKDAELFEVSVVSVPCNQSATFSLAKSFDSMDEYNEFKKTFTNRVDLAGQSLAKDEDSLIASDTPVSAEKSADQEIKMDNQNIDLEAFAKQVAEDTAAKIAMKQAEQKAAEEAKAKAAQEAEEAKALEAESIKTVINSGVESGVEKLMSDVEAKLSEKDAKMDEVIQSFQKELEEKKAEIAAMQSSKKDFSGRGKGDLSAFGKEFLQAKILGEITGKGFNTDYARDLQEKTVSITTNDGTTVGLDTTISSAFAYEVQSEYKVAQLFEELAVNSGATVLPFAAEPDLATFSNEGISKSNAADQNLLQDGGSNYAVTERILNAKRLIAGTFINGDTDEQTVVNLLPMLTRQLAVAHARAIDSAILIGNSSIKGLTGQGIDGTGTGTGGYGGSNTNAEGYATNLAETIDVSSGSDSTNHVTDTQLLSMRGEMGKYGMDPSKLAYVLPYDQYYNLMNNAGFTDISEVGSDVVAGGRGINPRVSGVLGYFYGVPVVASEFFADQIETAGAANSTAALLVHTPSFVIPRLRGVNIQSDFEVAKQRTAIVATQSLGFEKLENAAATTAVRIAYE